MLLRVQLRSQGTFIVQMTLMTIAISLECRPVLVSYRPNELTPYIGDETKTTFHGLIFQVLPIIILGRKGLLRGNNLAYFGRA